MLYIVTGIAVIREIVAVSCVTVFYKQGLDVGPKMVGHLCEGLQNWLDARENLGVVILVSKRPLFARTIDKY